MTEQRHAEIAGAGLAGLMAGAALAQRGWSVNIHERSDDLRVIGAGIWLWENGLQALEAVGAMESAIERGQHVTSWNIVDNRNATLRRRKAGPGDRLIVPTRSDVYNALLDAATHAGVKIVTGSNVVGATAKGQLLTDDGVAHDADLVIGADGIHSEVRDSLGLTKNLESLGTGAIRMLIPRTSDEKDLNVCTEYWSNNRVLLHNPCSPDEIYLCLVCPIEDAEGRRLPVDKDSWLQSFPDLAHILNRVGDDGRWDEFKTVHAIKWHTGKTALIGDAAHGLPPWLGQGANLGIVNALALAEFVSNRDVESGLKDWEAHCRPIVDHTTRWSDVFGKVTTTWPSQRQWMRSATVSLFLKLPFVERKINRAQKMHVLGDARRS